MSKIYNSITELVGHTPLVEFHRLEKVLGLKGRIAGKLEYFNPAGSHKDRPALEIIEEAEKRGEINPETTTLVEFTSGNMGIGIAAVAAAKGYKVKVGIQDGVSVERKKLLEAYGAELVLTPILGITVVFLASCIALPISLIILIVDKDHMIPFGPFLVAAIIFLYFLKIDLNSLLNLLNLLSF